MNDIIRHGSVMQDHTENEITPPDIVEQMTIKHGMPMGENENHQSGGSGLPSGGAPFQQLVTDADGVAKWEDKMGYVMPGQNRPIAENVTIIANYIPSEGGVRASAQIGDGSAPMFDRDMVFTVVWDGVEYRDLPWEQRDSTGYGGPGGGDCPFVMTEEYGYIYFTHLEEGEHTFSVYEQMPPKPVPIPEEFIPPMSGLVLRSPSGKLFKLSVSDDGEPAFAEVTD